MRQISHGAEDADAPKQARGAALVERDPELQDPTLQRLRDHFERYYAKRKLGFARVG